MSLLNSIQCGAVVFVGWQTMVVLEVCRGQAVLCPLIYDDEAHHRADVVLHWSELVEAGLNRVDVRCRAIPCQRDVRKLRLLGRVGSDVMARIVPAALQEQKRRVAERRGAEGWADIRSQQAVARARLVREGRDVRGAYQGVRRRVG
ncbi:hypothetical protein [Neokomagataea thailandica]|uniref:hypothetical protein n=1 Tax=Neokomagataea TaxID=1223423 RepID=UPI0012EEDCA2|nr:MULTISPECIES: hypothetical protein [Neokomagataea]